MNRQTKFNILWFFCGLILFFGGCLFVSGAGHGIGRADTPSDVVPYLAEAFFGVLVIFAGLITTFVFAIKLLYGRLTKNKPKKEQSFSVNDTE